MNQAQAQQFEEDRERLGKLIVQVSRDHAEGYRRSITQWDDKARRTAAENCANAASNTGWFILKALGFSDDKIRKYTGTS